MEDFPNCVYQTDGSALYLHILYSTTVESWVSERAEHVVSTTVKGIFSVEWCGVSITNIARRAKLAHLLSPLLASVQLGLAGSPARRPKKSEASRDLLFFLRLTLCVECAFLLRIYLPRVFNKMAREKPNNAVLTYYNCLKSCATCGAATNWNTKPQRQSTLLSQRSFS